MQNNKLLKKLAERYTLYTNPDVATTVEQGLMQLSSGIYTEEERFVFELLQNAVDSFDDTDNNTLNICLVIEGDYLVFMHNGAAFSVRDIEGLCDIGNGSKITDTKKIGYKGIGFKSVFMCSTNVTIESGDYCFKFDKMHWNGFWENNWKKEYGEKSDTKIYLMPWQIIPIETEAPVHLDTSTYNVATYIKTANICSLKEKITKLLTNSQFLLFLGSKNIQIKFISDNEVLAQIEKRGIDNVVTLSSNGNVESKWLTYTNSEVKVPEELCESIKLDINTPQKLKDTRSFELSFAIPIDKNGDIRKVDKEESVIYTYLPTSFKFGDEGFPFLVNANFITDAGRQQIHKDSEWNKLIFSKIPTEYLTWLRDISSTYTNYYVVLPKKSYGNNNALEDIYAIEMEKAIGNIAFFPRAIDVKSKVSASSAIMDEIGISEVISKELFIAHVNRTYQQHYSINDFIPSVHEDSNFLSEHYGIFVFNKEKLKALFDDRNAFSNIEVKDDIKLIDFLFQYYSNNINEREEFSNVLRETCFLLDEEGKLQTPCELFFQPKGRREDEIIEEYGNCIHYIHPLIDRLFYDKQKADWIKSIGVTHLSDLSFIKNVVFKKLYRINKDNSIHITRFLFRAYQKHNFIEDLNNEELSKFRFLTKKGNLESASDLYLGSKYKPETDIEPYYDGDIFISDEYCEDDKSIIEWNLFFTKLGVNSDIAIKNIKVGNCHNIPILEQNKKEFEEKFNTSNDGRRFYYTFEYFELYYAPFVLTLNCNYELQTIIWSTIFSKPYIKKNDRIYGLAGFWGISRGFNTFGEDCFLTWALKKYQKFPSTDGRYLPANELYCNTDDIMDIAGKYLPVINLTSHIHEDWNDILRLRNILQLDDYLMILTNISHDRDVTNKENNSNKKNEKIKETKERISKIYQRLVELDCITFPSKRCKVEEWAKSNKILSKDGVFRYPNELTYITLEGFRADNRVYIESGSNQKQIIELLSLMGVKVITENNIIPSFENATETNELKDMLLNIVSPITIVAVDEKKDNYTYEEKKQKIISLINNTHFYHCDTIHLTYGNHNDNIGTNTFCDKNKFYYTGILRAANIEPLLTPLCKYLDINKKERELFIMMIEDYEGIRNNLEYKGYDISLLEKVNTSDSGNIKTTLGSYQPNNSQQELNIITGFKGEIIVYEKLVSMGYEPECPSISTKDDYEEEIILNGKKYYCKSNYERYDITFHTKKGIKVYLEVKATTCDKSSQENMPISYRELSMIEECDSDEKHSYLIVRVFGIDKDTQDIYIFKGHLLKD